MSSFLPITGPCCLQGTELPGTPRGVFEPVSDSRGVGRYVTQPTDGKIVNDKVALVVLYDVFGFNIPNAKILADTFADRLKVKVVVPDYIPSPPPTSYLDPILETYPGEKANDSFFTKARGYLGLLRMIPYVNSVKDGAACPLTDKAFAELKAEGYEKLVAVGYCRGGSMVAHVMSKGDESLCNAGALLHPGNDKAKYPTITKPTSWHMASDDMAFKTPESREEVRKVFEGKPFDMTVYEGTVHGWAARPNLANEKIKKAFEDVHENVTAWAKTQLGV